MKSLSLRCETNSITVNQETIEFDRYCIVAEACIKSEFKD